VEECKPITLGLAFAMRKMMADQNLVGRAQTPDPKLLTPNPDPCTRCRLTRSCPCVDCTWFQRFKLKYDDPHSSFAFNFIQRRYNLVRRLEACETMGSATQLNADKTGRGGHHIRTSTRPTLNPLLLLLLPLLVLLRIPRASV